jgi:tagatose 6-phosphate kinase
MILVFAPNPALERVALVDKFAPGEDPQRPMKVSTFAGGAGLRAASVIRLLGGDVLALGFVGGHLGALLRDCLDAQDIPHVLTPIAAETRGDFLVLDREQGVITEIPEQAPTYTDAEIDKLLGVLGRHIVGASLMLIADGQEESAPELFARAIAHAKEAGVPVLADLCGNALTTAIEAGVWMVRMNLRTLQRHSEKSMQHDSAVLEEARLMIAKGVQNVVVTLGDEGALLINAEGAWRIKPPVVSHFNPTGSGETLSGAVAVWYEKHPDSPDIIEAVRYGCAAASVNVTHDEPGYATPGEVNVLFPRTIAGPVTTR